MSFYEAGGQQLIEILAEDFLSRIAEDLLRALIEQDDALIGVDGNDGVFRQIENPGQRIGRCKQDSSWLPLRVIVNLMLYA